MVETCNWMPRVCYSLWKTWLKVSGNEKIKMISGQKIDLLKWNIPLNHHFRLYPTGDNFPHDFNNVKIYLNSPVYLKKNFT